tara:strand:+ start:50 stop:292 length:243 start_codon:yes stop_codon:yes gene_type:complete
MKITKSQLKEIIKEEADSLLKESRTFNLYEIEEIIDEMLGGRADSYLADQLQAWWDGLQDDPAFMELGKNPSDKFSGRKG